MPSAEREMLQGCLEGDPKAWEGLWTAFGPAMTRAATSMLRSPAEAEEVCQGVLVKLAADNARALRTFSGRLEPAGHLERWLVAVTLRESLDHLRSASRRKRREATAGPDPKEVPSPLQSLCRAEDAERLHQALEALPARDRLLLRLRFWDGASHAETAALLKVSLKSITTLQDRSLARLKQLLEKAPAEDSRCPPAPPARPWSPTTKTPCPRKRPRRSWPTSPTAPIAASRPSTSPAPWPRP